MSVLGFLHARREGAGDLRDMWVSVVGKTFPAEPPQRRFDAAPRPCERGPGEERGIGSLGWRRRRDHAVETDMMSVFPKVGGQSARGQGAPGKTRCPAVNDCARHAWTAPQTLALAADVHTPTP